MKKKTGVFEWAVKSDNFQIGCENSCIYCSARYDAVHRFHLCTREQWAKPVINQAKVDKHRGKVNGVVMMPSTHDITPLNLSEYLVVLRRHLDAGNQVLVVSKPRWQCITIICEAYQEFKSQIMFRFTIGSMDDDVLGFWESGAPNFAERHSCLEYAYHKGFRTSVSVEPMLDAYPQYIYEACKDYITDSIWFGLLRNFDRRVDLTGVTPEQKAKFIDPLKKLQTSKAWIDELVKMMDGKPFVKWKDSMKQFIKASK